NALNAAADTITALAHTMGRGSKKSLLKIDFYQDNKTVTWIEEFEQSAKAYY
ncbi:40580_t:CDS:1, partial [Gigaspora margarita]